MRKPVPLTIILLWSVAASAAINPDAFQSLTKQGRAALEAGRTAEAERLFQQACPAEAIPAYLPAEAGQCYHHLAFAAMWTDRASVSAELFLKAAAAWQAAGPEYAQAYGITVLTLADLYRNQRDPAEAERVVRQYLAYLGANPQTEGMHPEALSRLALIYGDTGKPEKARETATEAIAEFGKLVPARPAEAAYAHNTLGLVDLSMGLQEEAVSHLRTAAELGTAGVGENSPEVAGYRTNLALALLARGEVSAAEQLLHRALYVAGHQPGGRYSQLGPIHAQLSAVAIQQNKLGIAAEEGKKALEILSGEPWPDEKMIASAQVNLGEVYVRTKKLKEADELLSGAIRTERRVAPESRLLADGLRRLAALRGAQSRWRESQDLLKEAIRIYEVRVGDASPILAPVLQDYAEALKHEGGSKAEIRKAETRAKAMLGFAPVR